MPRLTSTNLTDSIVRSAKVQDKRFDLYDAKVRGFGIRVQTSGTKSWFVMRRVNGRMTRKVIGRYPAMSLADARNDAAALLSKMARGVTSKMDNDFFFDDVVEEWIERDQQKNKTRQQVRNAIELHVRAALTGRKIDSISKSDINKIIDKISDSGAGVQANRVLAFLRRFFNWCIERDLLKSNPTLGIPKPTREFGRDRVLSLSELRAVFSAAENLGYPYGPLIQMLILTGQRRNEVGEAIWEEIDIPNATWTIASERSKNGQAHVVGLSLPLIKLLQSLPKTDGQNLLFSTTQTRPVNGYSKVKVRLDLLSDVNSWTLHDLRRTFATHATEKLKIDPVVVDKILNHQSGAVRGIAAVYQRGAYLKQRREALEKWAEFVGDLIANGLNDDSQSPIFSQKS